jgi:hypothetical protein
MSELNRAYHHVFAQRSACLRLVFSPPFFVLCCALPSDLSHSRVSTRGKPLYIGVHDTRDTATVAGLEQGYVVCPSDTRFLLLFTFLKKNLKKKVIVFFSTCNATKFYAELLNYIDIPVVDLHVCDLSLSYPFCVVLC